MGREKVYILDEAQRLSREAFDALLKVFEEPPPGVRFILATTEPHKMPPTIISRCQRFDFRRIPTDELAALVERVAKEEGISIDRATAESLSRQAEGSAREAEKLLDQTSLLGAGTVTEETVQALLGGPQEDIQFELADAVAVGDAQAVFALVQRVVEAGNDLRHMTGQLLGHFRDLLLVRSAPEDRAVLDADSERHGRLAAQAAKFSPGELSRILSLLVAAQTEMRWTTSPRLTLELALVRAALPGADPSAAGLASRIERLERLAGVEAATAPAAAPEVGAAAPAGQAPPSLRDDADHLEPSAVATSPPETEASTPSATDTQPEPEAVPVEADAEPEPVDAVGPHAPDTSSLDVAAIRRSWPQLLARMQELRRMVLKAHLESVTAAAFDGDTLELAFPPGRKFAVEKVQSKEEEFRDAFAYVFGVRPRIRCVARDVAGGPLVEEEPPASKEDALARLKAELGAEVES